MSATLILSQGKPCCKNKAGKGKISCKLNKANIESNKEINVILMTITNKYITLFIVFFPLLAIDY